MLADDSLELTASITALIIGAVNNSETSVNIYQTAQADNAVTPQKTATFILAAVLICNPSCVTSYVLVILRRCITC